MTSKTTTASEIADIIPTVSVEVTYLKAANGKRIPSDWQTRYYTGSVKHKLAALTYGVVIPAKPAKAKADKTLITKADETVIADATGIDPSIVADAAIVANLAEF